MQAMFPGRPLCYGCPEIVEGAPTDNTSTFKEINSVKVFVFLRGLRRLLPNRGLASGQKVVINVHRRI